MKSRKDLINYYRKHTIMLYLRWFNGYLTIPVFAEHHGITQHQATRLINIGREHWSRHIAKNHVKASA